MSEEILNVEETPVETPVETQVESDETNVETPVETQVETQVETPVEGEETNVEVEETKVEGESEPTSIKRRAATSREYVEDLEEDGPDPKELDLCEMDRPIRGQKYCCLSFVEPQFNSLEKKENFMTTEFLSLFLADYTKSVVETVANDSGQNAQKLLQKYNLIKQIDDTPVNFTDDKWKDTKELHESKIENHFFQGDVYDMLLKYKRFKEENVKELKQSMKKKFPDECFERGIKFRGAFSTYTKGRKFAGQLFKKDKSVNIFVVQSGAWVPFNPPQEVVGKQVTIDKQLNKLNWGYRKNQIYAEQFFKERKEEMIKDRVRRKTSISREQLENTIERPKPHYPKRRRKKSRKPNNK